MQSVENAVESGTTVVIDGKYFVGCRFTRCTVVYMGGDFGWMDSQFIDCKIMLQGSADRTANLLKFFGWAAPTARDSGMAELN